MFTFIKPHTNYDFMGTRKFWATISWGFAVLSVVLFFVKGLNYGIDFTGGVEINIRFNDAKIDTQKVRDVMKEVRSGDVQVQKFSDPEKNEYLIRFEGTSTGLNELSKEIETKLESKFPKGSYEIRKIDVVGPKVGQELKMSGIYSLLYALLGILIYVAIRFDYKFAPGAVIATMHDVIIIIGVFAVTRYQFTLSTVAALLTIIGYSVNDTIVVFDRIR
ncbi:MAG: protein translocase subunit SecF, partial [Pseudomonadota bacterium]